MTPGPSVLGAVGEVVDAQAAALAWALTSAGPTPLFFAT